MEIPTTLLKHWCIIKVGTGVKETKKNKELETRTELIHSSTHMKKQSAYPCLVNKEQSLVLFMHSNNNKLNEMEQKNVKFSIGSKYGLYPNFTYHSNILQEAYTLSFIKYGLKNVAFWTMGNNWAIEQTESFESTWKRCYPFSFLRENIQV